MAKKTKVARTGSKSKATPASKPGSLPPPSAAPSPVEPGGHNLGGEPVSIVGIGRPVAARASTLHSSDFAGDAQDAHRTLNNRIEGGTTTFIDITCHRQPQANPPQDSPSATNAGWTAELQP